MKFKTSLLLLLVLCVSCQTHRNLHTSPNKNIAVEHSDNNEFTVTFKTGNTYKEVMKITDIGMNLSADNAPFTFISRSGRTKIVDDYVMTSGKRKHCHNEANERIYHFKNADNVRLNLILRVYNDGVAFRYHFPQAEKGIVVTNERTKFVFAPDIHRWTQAYSLGYEGFYNPNTDGIANNKTRQWSFPALFETTDSTFVLLSEANVLRGNCGAFLSNKNEASVYEVELIDRQQTCTSQWYSPWRIAAIGSLADIVETTLITDVSEPCALTDTSWIKPGMVSWIYWAYNHGSEDYQVVKKYIDFAHNFKLPYVLIDADWDKMRNGGNINDALAYSHSKGVEPIIWYNSSTAWCGPTPLYRLNHTDNRDKEFRWLKEQGVKGIKVDFFGADSIAMINYYIDILEDAAKHGLMVNFHGGTIPRGWQRTYPNFMSSEAVYGAEWYNNNGTLTNNAAWHNCTLPFTRNAIGPMDYTPCAFTDSQHPHITSDAHELSLLVVFESALQHLADRPESFTAQPQAVRSFISDLPVVWDDTKLLGGYPSKSVAIARRSGNTWYVAALNGLNEPQTLHIDWTFLGGGEWSVTTYADKEGETKAWDIQNLNKVSPDDLSTQIKTLPRGGYVAVLRKE